MNWEADASACDYSGEIQRLTPRKGAREEGLDIGLRSRLLLIHRSAPRPFFGTVLSGDCGGSILFGEISERRSYS